MATSSSFHAAQISGTEASSYHPLRPRMFEALSPDLIDKDGSGGSKERLRGIIFDVDGTLCLPQNYMFREMRSALSIPKSTDILTHINSLSDVPDNTSSETTTTTKTSPRSRAKEVIRQIERNAMTSQRPQPGLGELMKYLESRNVPKALCTRNFPAPVQHLIETFLSDLSTGFDEIITRETEGVTPKPSPDGLWKIAQGWPADTVVDNEEGVLNDLKHQNGDMDVLEVAKRYLGKGVIMVGDSIDDMAAGYRAGAATVLLANDENSELCEHEYTDLSVRSLAELVDILENGFVGKP